MGKTTKEIRRDNLLLLIEANKTAAELSKRSGVSEDYISQLINRHQGRGMGHSVARRLEVELGINAGWMDAPHDDGGGDQEGAESSCDVT